MGTIKMRKRHAIRAALAALSVIALSIGAFALTGSLGGHAYAGQLPTPIYDHGPDQTYSVYELTGTWPPEVDIFPWAKCVAVTYIETAKFGSDLTECQGAFDVNYWRNFTGGVHQVSTGETPLQTSVSVRAQQTTKRSEDGCPETLDRAHYVKCLKVPGPSGGKSDGLIFSIGTYTGTDNDSSMRVDWDNGF